MILLWIALALALTGLWGLGMMTSLVLGMDDDSWQTRVAQACLAVVVSIIIGIPAWLTWRHIAGFER